ncbi:hypothetical protein C8A03DRAFT_19077 [Achaetomium macrosporum]|uniref:Uncharacterized protein n=1 Tax=Achaetomium macrosporum TaxID=79813 RepID=A0AAN7H7P9_9PEZI|nr:hypothetical protein C8A03DRAFT_19077 [Achaetomium macrosporum]
MSSPTPKDACQSLTTHVVLEWVDTSPNGQERSYLTAPDPSDAKIIFKSDISATPNGDANGSTIGVFIRLHIPVKLKRVSARTPIHIHVHPSRVQSCTFAVAVDVPGAIRASSPGQLASLSMTLSGPVQVVVPHNMVSSSPAKSRASGRVLDAIRSLGRATQLVMYMPANQAPRAHLQRLSALLTGGGLQALPPYTELFKSFGGSGGRIWDLGPACSATSLPDGEEDANQDTPPPYHELPAGPPAHPTSSTRKPFLSEVRDGKRRRRSTTSSSDAITELTTKKPDLRASPPRLCHSEKTQTLELSISQRLALLEALVHAQALQINRLSSENQEQRKRIDEYEAELAAVRLEIGRVDGQVDKLELEIAEQREDIVRLDGDVQYCLEREDEITEVVTDRVTEAVTDRISERGLTAANIIFTLEKG